MPKLAVTSMEKNKITGGCYFCIVKERKGSNGRVDGAGGVA
jgi:hypothetical protein